MQSSCDSNLQSMQLIHISLDVPRQDRQEKACCLFFRPSSSLICCIGGHSIFDSSVIQSCSCSSVPVSLLLLFRRV